MARSLVDTNILIYARDRDEPEKRRRAIEPIDGLAAAGELVLSVQCLNEFSATSLRRGVVVSEVGRPLRAGAISGKSCGLKKQRRRPL